MHVFSDAELHSYMLRHCQAYHHYHPRWQTFFMGVFVGIALAYLAHKTLRWINHARSAR